MGSFLRANPGLLISVVLLLAGGAVCLLFGFIMSRAGASLRPILWFAGFFALVVLPQCVGHLWMALRKAQQQTQHTAALESPPATESAGERADHARALFGPDADPQLVVDARGTFAAIGSPPESAQFAVLPDGSSVLLGRFANASAAEEAWVNYLRATGLSQLGGAGDSHRGYVATRPAGDRAYALPMGAMLGVWTAASDAAIVARMQAGGFSMPRRAPILASASTHGSDSPTHTAMREDDLAKAGQTVTKQSLRSLPAVILVPVLVAYLLLIAAYFFRGAAWAGSSPALPSVERVAATTLAARLESINTLDVPFSIECGDSDNELIATWRYADAKWVGHARAHGLRRTFRIRMTLDEATQTVRATDYAASYDWSTGHGGAEISWKAGLGIVFFQREHARVFGLQFDELGRMTPELSYAYTFNLDELKAPLRTVVTRAGWTWRPTVWQGPTWLRWLTG